MGAKELRDTHDASSSFAGLRNEFRRIITSWLLLAISVTLPMTTERVSFVMSTHEIPHTLSRSQVVGDR